MIKNGLQLGKRDHGAERKIGRLRDREIKEANGRADFITGLGENAIFYRLEHDYAGYCRDPRLRRASREPDCDFCFSAIFEKAVKIDSARTFEILKTRIREYERVKWKRNPGREAYEGELKVLMEFADLAQCEKERGVTGAAVRLVLEEEF